MSYTDMHTGKRYGTGENVCVYVYVYVCHILIYIQAKDMVRERMCMCECVYVIYRYAYRQTIWYLRDWNVKPHEHGKSAPGQMSGRESICRLPSRCTIK